MAKAASSVDCTSAARRVDCSRSGVGTRRGRWTSPRRRRPSAHVFLFPCFASFSSMSWRLKPSNFSLSDMVPLPSMVAMVLSTLA